MLADKPRPGCPGTFTAEQICRVLALACEKPPEHLSHWAHPELVREAARRGIVERISETGMGRFLKSGCSEAPTGQILAEPNRNLVRHPDLPRRLLKRGTFSSKEELKQRNLAFIEHYNQDLAKPFRWTYIEKPLMA